MCSCALRNELHSDSNENGVGDTAQSVGPCACECERFFKPKGNISDCIGFRWNVDLIVCSCALRNELHSDSNETPCFRVGLK